MEFTSELAAACILMLVAILFCIIIYFRHRLNSQDVAKLKEKHRELKGAEALTGRSKFPEADGFRHSGAFLNFSLLAAVIIALLALNWTTFPRDIHIPNDALDDFEDIEIEPLRTAEPPPPPPPPPPPVIQEVPEDLIEEDEQPKFQDMSIETETAVEAPPRPEVPQLQPPLPVEPDDIFVVAEDMPRFPGCENLPSKKEKEECAQKKMLEFIYANIKYPAIARENGIEGTVVISFVVEKDGSIKSIEVKRDIGAGCGDEAKRVVELLNSRGLRWIPGKQRGQPVRVQFNLPVRFRLQ